MTPSRPAAGPAGALAPRIAAAGAGALGLVRRPRPRRASRQRGGRAGSSRSPRDRSAASARARCASGPACRSRSSSCGTPSGSTRRLGERDARAAGVMMIPIPAAGVLEEVTGHRAARAIPGIEDVTISAHLGAAAGAAAGGRSLPRASSSRERRRPDRAEAALREAHARLVFRISRVPRGEARPAARVVPSALRAARPTTEGRPSATGIAVRRTAVTKGRPDDRTLLGGRVVRIAASGVVGRVEDLADERSEPADGLLDSLLQRDVGGAAALAAAAEAQDTRCCA